MTVPVSEPPIPESLKDTFLRAVGEYGMFPPSARVLLAVSGGKDSFTMLDLCGQLRERHFPNVHFTAVTIRTDIT